MRCTHDNPYPTDEVTRVNFKQLADKAKAVVQKNPQYIDKGADAVNKATKGKYSSQVDKGRDAAKKFGQQR
ncbi:MT0933-like antitoxin protein [Williamsia deligens]|nr:MT0933-like antitoxin protein [Williamsia deligens]